MPACSAMIIDDSDIARWILRTQLEQVGIITIFEENDGESALTFFENYEDNKHIHGKDFPPRVVFLDVNMPIVDGPEFLEKFAKIRQHHDLSSCTIIVYSASENSEELVQMVGFDFVDKFLVKGKVSIELLAKTLDEL